MALALLVLCLGACSGDEPPSAPAATVASATPVATAPPVEVRAVSAPEPVDVADRAEQRFELSEADFLAVEAGSVWLKRASGFVERIDPTTNAVTSIRIEAVGNRPCDGLGAGAGTVWSCIGEGALARIDPATNAIVATVDVGKDADNFTIPVGFGHVWALSEGGTSLVGVNLSGNEVDVRIPLEEPCTDLGLGAGALWVACLAGGEVLRVDPVQQQVTARIGGLKGVRAVAVADVVYAGFDGGIARLDPTTAEVTAAVAVPAGAFGAGMTATADAVWVRVPNTFLQRLDPTTLDVLEVLRAPERSGGSVVVGFGSVWASAVDDAVLYRIRDTAS